ncbi:Prefoldin subunit alpha [archaeon HR01]|nr:Prefoldin subunit alpha [archaeon HR01]
MSSDERLARVIADLQTAERIVADLNLRILNIERSIEEHENAVRFIQEIKKGSGPYNLLIPLGAGVFARVELTSPDILHVNLGAQLFAQKSLEESEQILTRRSQSLQQARDNLSRRAAEYMSRVEELRRFINAMLSQQQQAGR